jgi:hypothetical protein
MSVWKIYFIILSILSIINIVNQYMTIQKFKNNLDLNTKDGQFEFDMLSAGSFLLMYIFIMVLVAFAIPAIFMN